MRVSSCLGARVSDSRKFLEYVSKPNDEADKRISRRVNIYLPQEHGHLGGEA